MENLNASARQGWIPWSRHTHRAVADSQMLGQQPRTPVCDTVFLRWRRRFLRWRRQRDRDQVVAVQVCVADRSGPRRTSPTRRPPNEERQVGRFGARVHAGRSPPAGPAKGRRRNGGPTVPRTTCSAAAAHTWRSAPGCDRHWPIGRKTNASLIPSQSNRLRTHADNNHLMSETQRTAIDIARDHAHSQRDFSELRH